MHSLINIKSPLVEAIFAPLSGEIGETPPVVEPPTDILPAPEGATIISSLPYTCSSAGDYALSGDLSRSSGTAITVTSSGVVIYGEGNEITYASTGAGVGIDVTASVSSFVLNGLTLTQGVYTGTGDIRGLAALGTGHDISACTFNVIARLSATATFGARMSTSGSNAFYKNTMNLSGTNRFYGFRGIGAWDVYENVVNVSNHTHSADNAPYPYIFYVYGDNHRYYDNVFNVGLDSSYINGISAFGSFDNCQIYNNTFNWASDHGRCILADDDTSNWDIYDNDFYCTGSNPGAHNTYIFRARSSGTGGASFGHKFHGNLVDCTGSTGTHGCVIGDDNPDTYGIRIYNNHMKTTGDTVQCYSSNVTDMDVYSNYLEFIGGGYTGITCNMRGTGMTDIIFSNNEILGNQADGDLIEVDADMSANVTFCLCDISAGDVRGGSVNIDNVGPCQDPWLGEPPIRA